ncbi:MAG: sulfur carrier protein ThiS [Terriglobia bacterium]
MQVTINGELRAVPEGVTLRDLLSYLKLEEERVAVERNRAIVGRQDWAAVRVQPGDELEIVHFVGGG